MLKMIIKHCIIAMIITVILPAVMSVMLWASPCDPPPDGQGPCDGPAMELMWQDDAHDPFCWTVGQIGAIGYQVQADRNYCDNGWVTDDIVPTWSGMSGTVTPFTLVPNTSNIYVTWFGPNPSTPCGVYHVTLTVDDVPACSTTDSAPISRTDTVYIKPNPMCPKDGSATMGCSGGGGGCGSGSCVGGGGYRPAPSITWPIVRPTNPVIVGPGGISPIYGESRGDGDGGSSPSGGDGGSSDDCSGVKVEILDTCSGYYAKVMACGKCQSAPFDYQGNVTISIGGLAFTGSIDANHVTTFTATGDDDSTMHFTIPAPPQTTFVSVAGPDIVTDPSGKQTHIVYNEPELVGSQTLYYNRITTPNGQIWKYYHEQDSSKITKAVAPDGTYTEVTYVTGGNAGGRVQVVASYDALGNPLSSIIYTYYDDGRLETATKGNAQTLYVYQDPDVNNPDRRTVEMVERSAVNPNIRYSRTVYSYGALTSDTTTVTRKKQLFAPTSGPDIDVDDQTTTYVFDGSVNDGIFVKTYVHSVTDPSGLRTEYSGYDSYGSPSSISTWNGTTKLGSTSYIYNSEHALTQTTNYDVNNLALSTETNTYYTGSVYLKTHMDNRGNYTRYVRDTNSLWKVDAIKVSEQVYGSEPSETEWDAIAPIKVYEYYTADCSDGMAGQLWKETVPDIEGTTDQVTEYKYGYGVTGKWRTSPTSTIYSDASGTPRPTTTVYDDMGKIVSTTDANGVATVNDPNDYTIWYRYDALGRQTKTVYKWLNNVVDGTPEVYTENSYSCCTLDWSKDENGNKTYYQYDDANRVIGNWTDIQGNSTSTNRLVAYAYDSFGNQQAVTTYSDASTSRITSYLYDKNNRVTKIIYPCNSTEGDILGSEEFGYDIKGNLQWKKDGNGSYTYYKYDTLSRVTDVYYDAGTPANPFVYPSGDGDVHYGYQSVNDFYEGYCWLEDTGSTLKTSMTDSSGTSYYYDGQSRLSRYVPSTKDQDDYVIAYTYNNLSQKTSISIGKPDVNATRYGEYDEYYRYARLPLVDLAYNVSYDYYANGWLKDVKNGLTTIASYGYDAVGNRMTQTNHNGTSTTYAYNNTDSRYSLNTITHSNSSGTLATISYTAAARDNAGNPMSMTDWTGTWNYGYDANNRLITATPPNPVPDQPAGGPYGYDWVGNRLNPPTGTNHMVYNAADQLTSWPGMHTYTYDGAGNLIDVNDAGGVNVQRHYTYTPGGLLDTVCKDSSCTNVLIDNTWDADKNRVSFTTGGIAHTFVYDTNAGIPAVIDEDGVYYIREPNGSLIAQIDSSNTRYYHFDTLGSTRLLTNDSGVATDKYSYDAYGALISHEGTTQQPYQYVGRYGYYTYHQVPELGIMQLGVRFYDPESGRFISRDVIQEAFGRYAYAGLRPSMAIDPSGLAYMIFKDNKLCLYHDTGKVWMCCNGVSGLPGKIPPIGKGIYRLDPKNICCLQEGFHPAWACERDLWGNWRCHLENISLEPGQEKNPHDRCFIHGGCEQRPGTAGCIRISDLRYEEIFVDGICFTDIQSNNDDCLEKLMKTLRDIGTPIRVIVK